MPDASSPFVPTRLLVGMGCFWSTQAVLSQLVGLSDLEAGYLEWRWGQSPRTEPLPVDTFHRVEVVQAQWDPHRLPPAVLAAAVGQSHVGSLIPAHVPHPESHCRSVWVCEDPAARAALEAAVAAAKAQDPALQTEVFAQASFQRAPSYDQAFYRKRPHDGFCVSIIEPKLRRLRERFQGYLAC